MKVSPSARQQALRSWRWMAMITLLAIVSLLVATTDSALAQKKRRPTPTPPPPPTVLAVPPPQVIQVVAAEGNRFIVAVDLGSDYVTKGEFVSGPVIPVGDFVTSPGPQALSVDGGYTWLTNLVPNSDYVFRFKRTFFFDRATNMGQAVTSPYTTFSFRTPTLEQSRPSAPVITLGEVASAFITVNWSPSTDNVSFAAPPAASISYVYTIDTGLNSGTLQPTCSSYCFGATGLSINRPAPGTKLVVFAIDSAGNQSLASNELIIP